MKHVYLAVNWGLGSIFLIVSLLAIINSSFVAGLLLLTASVILIPTTRDFVSSRLSIELSPAKRGGTVAVLFLGFLVTMESSNEERQAKEASQNTNWSSEAGAEKSGLGLPGKSVSKVPEKESMTLLKANLSYPRMGVPYNDARQVCDSEPSSSGNEEGHYECFAKSEGSFVFGPDRRLKARWFSFGTGPDEKSLLSKAELLAVLDERFGERLVTQKGSKQFSYSNQPREVTAVSYGCKAYFFDKPGMHVPGGTPDTHQVIWKETGVVPPLDAVARYDFEVVKAEVQNIKQCVVAVVEFGGYNIPTGIEEEQRYFSSVSVMEVDPSFGLLNSKHW